MSLFKIPTLKLCFLLSLFSSSLLLGQSKNLVINQDHSGLMRSVIFSPNGKKILTGASDRTAKIWDVSTRKLLHTYDGYVYDVKHLAFSKDEKYLLTGSNGQILLRETLSGKIIHHLKHMHTLKLVGFSKDGKTFYAGYRDGVFNFWNIKTGKLIKTFKSYWNLSSVALSPDENTVATAVKNVELWNVNTKAKLHVLKGHDSWVRGLGFSPNGKKLFVGYLDETIEVWDITTQKLLNTFPGNIKSVTSVSFSNDRTKVIFGGMRGQLNIRDTQTGELLKSIKVSKNDVNCSALSPDGSLVVTGGWKLQLWNVPSGKQEHLFRMIKADNYPLGKISPDGRYYVMRKDDNQMVVVDLITGKPLETLRAEGKIYEVDFTANSRQIFAKINYNTLALWEISTGKQLQFFKLPRRVALVSYKFSAAGDRFLTGYSNGTTELWDVKSGQKLQSFTGHQRKVTSVEFSNDQTQILTGGEDKTVKLWQVDTGKLLHTFRMFAPRKTRKGFATVYTPSITKSVFSANGASLLALTADRTGGRATLKIWNKDSKELLDTQLINSVDPRWLEFSADRSRILYRYPFSKREYRLRILASKKDVKTYTHKGSRMGGFLKGEKVFLTRSPFNVSWLWDVKSGKELGTLYAYFADKEAWLLITPDGKYDGNEAGLKNLYYVKGVKVKSLPKRDPKRVKGLWKKLIR
ncbi:MAG TPA: hypothetical protein DCS93_07620 [Microscillaceae bacterium]|nr:hypothetical protein [Microscillaceae bacterium]